MIVRWSVARKELQCLDSTDNFTTRVIFRESFWEDSWARRAICFQALFGYYSLFLGWSHPNHNTHTFRIVCQYQPAFMVHFPRSRARTKRARPLNPSFRSLLRVTFSPACCSNRANRAPTSECRPPSSSAAVSLRFARLRLSDLITSTKDWAIYRRRRRRRRH